MSFTHKLQHTIKAETDMFLYLGRGSDPDNRLVECAWDMANRSTRSFLHYNAIKWGSGGQAEVVPVTMKIYYRQRCRLG